MEAAAAADTAVDLLSRLTGRRTRTTGTRICSPTLDSRPLPRGQLSCHRLRNSPFNRCTLRTNLTAITGLPKRRHITTIITTNPLPPSLPALLSHHRHPSPALLPVAGYEKYMVYIFQTSVDIRPEVGGRTSSERACPSN